MKKIIFFLSIVIFLASCAEKTKITGHISNADNAMLYFECNKMSNIEVLDSVKLNKKGKFSFSVTRNKYPEFYRLRVNDKTIMLALDSVSENVIVDADVNDIFNAEIEGSEESVKILELRRSSYELQKIALSKDLYKVDEKLELHRFLAQNIILDNPRSAAAYYALYQTVYGYYYLDPYNKNDLKYWSAVATSYSLFYPDYYRTEPLRTQTLTAMSMSRDKSEMLQKIIDVSTVQGFVDIALPNRVGDIVKLSSLVGDVVLIDFTSYSLETASAHTLFLRELYDKYASRGFNIYQVSVDPNHLLWVEKSREMPWISVRDNDPLNCKALSYYNVTELPTFFLMDRNGDIVGRFNHENLEKAILEIL